MSLPKPYYQDDSVTLYHGDNRDILRHLNKVDMIATDPPYGIDFQSARPTEKRKKEKIKGDGLEDYLKMLPQMLASFKSILVDGGCCCCCGGGGGTPSLAYLWIEAWKHLTVENVCVWDKGFIGMGWRYRFQWEAVLIDTNGDRKTWNGGENRSNILRFQKIIPQNGDHPTPKPESLMSQLILDNSNLGETVLDPYCGSGATLVSAKTHGRKAIGIEIEEKYCEIAVKRLQQEVFQF